MQPQRLTGHSDHCSLRHWVRVGQGHFPETQSPLEVIEVTFKVL